MKILIVMPTYNEKENIKKIIPLIRAADRSLHVLVIDDASPDGTADEVKKIAKKNRNVRLLERSGKLGLGTAYVEGFKYAIKHKYDYVFEMDADFSHDPKFLGDFIIAMKESDVVVGSRYLKGVSVVNWPISRLILSTFASFYARTVTGMPLSDCTSGFNCYRREVLEAINPDTIHSDGYSFQIEMHYKAWKKGFRVKEVPIIFVDRHSGTSKLSDNIIWEAIFIVWKLRLGLIK
jgi:dolichol-phosphate mannosyltransferase